MKKLALFTCLALMVFVCGCSRKPVEAEITGSYTGSFKAEAELPDYGNGTGEPLWMEAYDEETNTKISWDLMDVSEGTHYLGSSPYMMFIDSNTTPYTSYETYKDTIVYTSSPEGESGTIVIEQYTDALIKGSFDFVAEVWNSTKTVTVIGTFVIPIE